ncbi:unnamed protein product [Lupinus luteus]|uniref:Late nodulin domain-containing protein n=1 Tax=Lupinus luteus TaxID=3873 RepID=A0AAV1X5N8_LUPLU
MAGIHKFIYGLVLFSSIFVVVNNAMIDYANCQVDSDCICDRDRIPKCIGDTCFCWKIIY